MADDQALEQRIRELAYRIWLEAGKPEGHAQEHWDIAKLAIAEADALPSMLKPPELPGPEPIEAWTNQAEFPTLVDQGEGLPPVVVGEDNR